MKKPKLILVTGATGYVGGRLVPRLLEAGLRVRCMVRDPSRLEGRSWLGEVEVVRGDVMAPESLVAAMAGVDSAYYLVHSMNDSSGFHERDVKAAHNFGAAAKGAGVQRIIYLGGLGDPRSDLSEHLLSRQDTGRALQEAGVPTTEFRAAIIVGAGSASFEMIRCLTERVPIMVCPRWVFTRAQPIAIHDVLAYLVGALDTPESTGLVIEIGGADVLTYGDMMLGYARARGLRRLLIAVPVLTPRLSSYWVHLVTPIPAAIARPLIEGLRNEVIVRDQQARRLFKGIHPTGYLDSVASALQGLEAGNVETTWTDSLATSLGDRPPVVLTTLDGMIIERRNRTVDATPASVFRIISGLGGERGWLYLDWLWRLRGEIDRILGGVGFRRGRRHPLDIRVGDAVDFWRVEAYESNRLLRLRAEMRLPGRAWLQFEAHPVEGQVTLTQTAFFAPKGLSGLLYWYGLYPIHRLIFSGMIGAIADQAEGTGLRTSEVEGART
jgi:uncharacterized protein YbjT (DUF2867 family)